MFDLEQAYILNIRDNMFIQTHKAYVRSEYSIPLIKWSQLLFASGYQIINDDQEILAEYRK